MNGFLTFTLSLVSAAVCFGQIQVTVPAPYAAADAPSLTWIAGIGSPARQQILIDAVHLTALQGRTITALRFRHDFGLPDADSGGTASIVVRLATLTRPAVQALPSFTANITGSTEVFRGTLVVSPVPSNSSFLGWQPPHVVEIRLLTPFTYSGGGMAIELDSPGPLTTFFWPVDADRDATVGNVVHVGVPCGPYAATGPTAGARAEDLIPGSTARLWFRHEPGALALMMIGAPPSVSPTDLTRFGFAGCSLWVSPMVNLPLPVSTTEVFGGFGGVAISVIDLPLHSAFLGARFGVQWLGLASTLVTSDALDCRLAASLPSIGVSVVEQRPSATAPQVFLTTAPVVQFEAH